MNFNNHSCKILSTQSKSDILLAAKLIKEEKLVALPTETVYGLAANAFSERAVNNIFLAKGRPLNNPLILHVKDLESALPLLELNVRSKDRLFKLALKFWPGPLTIIAQKSGTCPDLVCAGKETVAIRVPDNKPTLEILKILNFPLAMPSANLSSRPSPTKAMHVFKQMGHLIEAVLDAGDTRHGIESSVLYIDSLKPQLLRPGSISLKDLALCLDEEVILGQKGETPISPGQQYLHYSPKVSEVSLMDMHLAHQHWPNEKVIIMARKKEYEELIELLGKRASPKKDIIMPDEHEAYAQKLYAALNNCESYPKHHLIIIVPKVNKVKWRAVFDRISRSAKII